MNLNYLQTSTEWIPSNALQTRQFGIVQEDWDEESDGSETIQFPWNSYETNRGMCSEYNVSFVIFYNGKIVLNVIDWYFLLKIHKEEPYKFKARTAPVKALHSGPKEVHSVKPVTLPLTPKFASEARIRERHIRAITPVRAVSIFLIVYEILIFYLYFTN